VITPDVNVLLLIVKPYRKATLAGRIFRQLATGNWQLATGNWQLTTDH